MSNKIKFKSSGNDLGDFYEPSDDSDDGYTEREKTLLKKVRNSKQRKADQEAEVLAFDDADDDDDDEDDEIDVDHVNFDDNDDDVDDDDDDDDDNDEDDGIPDSRAWGSKRKDFYSTDFVDQDYSSYTVPEDQLAEQEEEEAANIHDRLLKQNNEIGYRLMAKKTPSIKSSSVSTTIAAAIDKKQRKLLESDPDLDQLLVEDCTKKMDECEHLMTPILEYFKQKQISDSPFLDFLTTRNNLVLSYLTNFSFYLYMKAKRAPLDRHPVFTRLEQTQILLLELNDLWENHVRPESDKILQGIREGKNMMIVMDKKPIKPVEKPTKKKLNLIKTMKKVENVTAGVNGIVKHAKEFKDNDDIDDIENDINKKDVGQEASESDEEENMEVDNEAGDDDNDDARRQITYQMSKNKGLTPHRKKELRNPRVKHRNKFRKAIVRRKGAVRTVVKETKRYGGEASGIKASTKKGIKIK